MEGALREEYAWDSCENSRLHCRNKALLGVEGHIRRVAARAVHTNSQVSLQEPVSLENRIIAPRVHW
jgi:hypothetical protein